MSLKKLVIALMLTALAVATATRFRPQPQTSIAPQAAIDSLTIHDDEFTLDPARNATPSQIFSDPKGNLYVLGTAEDTIGKWWIVRRKRPADLEWSVADRFQLETGQPAEAIKGYYDETLWPAIFVEGVAQLKPGETHFINRSSRDDGTSWKTVWQENGTKLSTRDSPLSAISPTAGPFQAGSITDPTGKPNWIVHLFSKNSQNPIESDRFLPELSVESAARWMTVDGVGRAWVGGDGSRPDGTRWWAIRVSEDHGKSWRTVHLSNVPEGSRMVQGLIARSSLWILSTQRSPQGGQLWVVTRIAL
jgi:hypothetical protein